METSEDFGGCSVCWSIADEVDDESEQDVGDEGKQACDGVEHANEESPAEGAV
jgi:hypothetical protein